MIYRIAAFFDRIERERPALFRVMTSNWLLLGLAIIIGAAAWYVQWHV
jgi:hypothetical protein